MKGIILAGGTGSRLFPITSATSKQLLPVYDKPLIYYPLSNLMHAGIREILIISTPAHTEHLRRLFGDGDELGLELSYTVQEQPRGTAEAFLIAEEFLAGSDVCMTLGDNLIYGNDLIGRLVQARRHVEETRQTVLFCAHVNNPRDYGVVEYDHEHLACSIEEKPEVPKSNFAVTGLGFYAADVVERAKLVEPSIRGELENTDVLRQYMEQRRLKIFPLGRGDAWLDAGSPDMLLQASSFVRTIESRMGLKIACLEEIAFNQRYISAEKMDEHIARHAGNTYGDYLRSVKESPASSARL